MKNEITFYLFLLTIISIYGCGEKGNRDGESLSKQIKSERCNCYLDIYSSRSNFDSIQITRKEREVSNPSLGFGLPPKLKKYLDFEIKYEYKRSGQNIENQTVVKKIIDKFPDITNFSSIKKEYFCALVKTICLDTTLTDKEVINFKQEKLEEIDALFESIYLNKIGINNSEKSIYKISHRRNNKISFSIYSKSLNQKLVDNLIQKAENQNLLLNKSNPAKKINILLDDTYNRMHTSNKYFSLTEVNLLIEMNKSECLKIEINLEKEFEGLSGTLETLKKKVKKSVNNWASNNVFLISEKINSCIK